MDLYIRVVDLTDVLRMQVKKMMQKTTRRKLVEQLSDEQLQREKAIERSQLDAIRSLVSSTAAAASTTTTTLQSANDVAQPDMVNQQLRMYFE